MSRRTILAIGNAVALLVALLCNGLANALPLNGMTTGALSDLYPNLFVPMGATFSIWGLIYLGLMGLVGYGLAQLRAGPGETAVERLGPWMVVNLLANSAWIFAWHWLQVELSVVLMGVILGSLIAMHRRLGVGLRAAPVGERWLVHMPVSVYLGWISVATIANLTTLAVDHGVPPFGDVQAALTVGVMAVAVSLAGAMLWRHRDVPYALVVVWAFIGIAVKRGGSVEVGSPLVASAAGVGVVVVGLGVLAAVAGRLRRPPAA
jgi:hypothetical protein